jgi:hypothetical protein
MDENIRSKDLEATYLLVKAVRCKDSVDLEKDESKRSRSNVALLGLISTLAFIAFLAYISVSYSNAADVQSEDSMAVGHNQSTKASCISRPAQVFAPYLPIYWQTPNSLPAYLTSMKSVGIKYITLAFILASTDGTPMFNGDTPDTITAPVLPFIQGVRSAGGDVILSFGGQSGVELANKITDLTKLIAAYQSIINYYDVSMIDFDIEEGNMVLTGSVYTAMVNRHKAIKALKIK